MTSQTPNPMPFYEIAADEFGRLLKRVSDADLKRATPCAEWDVQALVNHNILITGFVHGVLTENITVNPYEPSGSFPDEGPVAAFEDGVGRVLDLTSRPGSLERVITTPFGEMPVGAFMFAPMVDLVIHQHDLGAGLGEQVILNPALVDAALGACTPQMMDVFWSNKLSDPELPTPADASPQQRLLALWGRRG